MDESVFLKAIASSDAARAVYADWLEEQNRSPEAEEQRVRAALADLFRLSDCLEKEHLTLNRMSDGYELVWGKMYNAPAINFGLLKQLGDLFGTENIDVDDYSQGGCESCDWGSDYGHGIQIRAVTRLAAGLDAILSGQDSVALIERRRR